MKKTTAGLELRKEMRSEKYRREIFEILYHYYTDPQTGEVVPNPEMDEINNTQLANSYRAKYNLPFPDEIKAIREKYKLPASKMAEVLGFGINVYRNYENGEIPSSSNARLIQLAKNPTEFKSLVKLSGVYDGNELDKLISLIESIEREEKGLREVNIEEYLMGENAPTEYNGFKVPRLDKFLEMIVFFSEKMRPWKTKMNKLLFYADFLHYKRTCYSISGAEYRAIQLGPVPNNFSSIFDHAAMNDYVDITYTEFPDGGIGEQFTPHPGRSFMAELFTDSEKEVMNDVVVRFENAKTQDMVKLSHVETGWIENTGQHRGISYQFAFDLKSI